MQNFLVDLTGEHLIEDVEASLVPFEIGDPGVVDEAGMNFGLADGAVLDLDFVKKAGARAFGVTRQMSRRQRPNHVQGGRHVLVGVRLKTAA